MQIANSVTKEMTSFEINGVDKLIAFYEHYGKEVPEEVFDTDFFEEGKRVPLSEMDTNLCLCSANPDAIIDFAARAIMKETRGIDVDAELDAKQQVIHQSFVRKINHCIDHLTTSTFRGKTITVTTSWM